MSQSTLPAFATPGEQAASAALTASDAGSGRGSCRACGAHVTPRFRAVFGDADDRAHACYECASQNAIRRGAAADAEARVGGERA